MSKLEKLLSQEKYKDIIELIENGEDLEVSKKLDNLKFMVEQINSVSTELEAAQKRAKKETDCFTLVSNLKQKHGMYVQFAMLIDSQIGEEYLFEAKDVLKRLNSVERKHYSDKLNKFKYRFETPSEVEKMARRKNEEKFKEIKQERLNKIKLINTKIAYYTGKSPKTKEDYSTTENTTTYSTYSLGSY